MSCLCSSGLSPCAPATTAARAANGRCADVEYKPSGARLGMYFLDRNCDHAEIWWEDETVGKVMISGNPRYSYVYARRISRDYWRLAEVTAGYPHLGTLKREAKRWVLRDQKARLVIYTSGPNAVQAALAYLTFGRDCTVSPP